MNVKRAKVLGYCVGVKRAVEAAEQALQSHECESETPAEKKIYTLGPLIHNPVVLEKLGNQGLKILNAQHLDDVTPPSIVIIRAHGTTPHVMQELSSKGAEVIDATCPRVHLSQKRAREWSGKGYAIVIAGDRNHGEVTSISAFSSMPVTVIENAQEAECIDLPNQAVLIAQTTFSPIEFEKISGILRKKNPDIEVFNSICSATMERQEALAEFAGQVDGILVIGGRNSANTRRLYESAKRICEQAALIENAEEIPEAFFSLKNVGITAGASTPDDTIDEVEQRLQTASNLHQR